MGLFRHFVASLAITVVAAAFTEQAGILRYQAPRDQSEGMSHGGASEGDSRCSSPEMIKAHLEAVFECSSKFNLPTDHVLGTLNMWTLKRHFFNGTHLQQPPPETVDHAKMEEFENTYKQLVSSFKPKVPEFSHEKHMDNVMCFGVCVNKRLGLLHENGTANHGLIRKRLGEISKDKIPSEIGDKIIESCHSLSGFKPEDVVSDKPMDPAFSAAMCPAPVKFTMCIGRTLAMICRMMMDGGNDTSAA